MNDSSTVEASTEAQPKRRSKRRVEAPKVTLTEVAVAVAPSPSPSPEQQDNMSNITRIQLSSTAKGAFESTRSKTDGDDGAGARERSGDDDAAMNKIDSVSKKLDDDCNDVNKKCDTTAGHLDDDVQKNYVDTATCTDTHTRTHEHSSMVSKSANVSCSDEDDVTTAAKYMVDFANVAKKGSEDLSKSASDDTDDSLTIMIQRANDALVETSEVNENIEESSDDCEKKDKGGMHTRSNKENEEDDDDVDSHDTEDATRDDGQDKDDNHQNAGIQSIASMLERADSALQTATHLETEDQVLEKRNQKNQSLAAIDEEVQMAINTFGTTTPALCDNDTSTSVVSKISHQTRTSNSTNATVVSVEAPQYQGPLHNDYTRSTHDDGVLSNYDKNSPRQAVPERMENSPHHQGMISQALGSLKTMPIHPRQYTREQQWQHNQQQYYEQQQRWQHEQQQMRWQCQRQEQEIRRKNAQRVYWQERSHSQLMSKNATNKIPIEPEQREGNNVTALDEIEQNQQQVNHAKTPCERPNSATQEAMKTNATHQTEKEIRQWLFQQQQERISRRNSYDDAHCAASIIRDMADGHAESSDKESEQQPQQQQQQHQHIAHVNDRVDDLLELASKNDLLELARKAKKQGQQHPSDETTKQSVKSKMPLSQFNSDNRERAEEEQEEVRQFQENDKESERQTQKQQGDGDGNLELSSKEQHSSSEEAEQIVNSKMPPSQSDNEPRERAEKEQEEEQQFLESGKESGKHALQQQDDVDEHLELASKEQDQDQHSNDEEAEQMVNSRMPPRQSDDEPRERAEKEQQFRENEKNHPIYIYRIGKPSMNQQVEQIEKNLENTAGMKLQTRQSSRKTLQQQQHDRTNVEDKRNGQKRHQTCHNNIEETMNKVQVQGKWARGPGGSFIRRNQQHKLSRSVGQDPNELDKGNNSTFNGNKKRKLGADNSIAGEQHNLRPRRSLRSTQRYVSSGSDRVILNNTPNLDLKANLEDSLLKTKSPQSKGLLSDERTLGENRKILDSCDDSQERSRSNVKRVSQDSVGPLQCIHIEKQAVVEDTHIDSIPIARCWNPSCREEQTLSNLMRCTQCEKALYCNQNCQIAHWESNHSQTCKPPKFRAQDGPEQPGNGLNASPSANRQTGRFSNNTESKEVAIQGADPIVVAPPAPPAITMEQIQTLIDNKVAETARALNIQTAEQRKLLDEKLKETILRLNAEAEKERKILDTELKKKDASIHGLQLQVRKQSEINVGKMIDEKIKKTVDALQHQVGEEKVIIEQKLKERDATIHTLQLQVNKQAEEGRKLLDQRIKETILTIQLQTEDERGILDNKLKERDSTIRTLQLQMEKLEKDMRRSFGQTKRVDDL